MNELDRADSIGCPDAETLAAWSDGGLRADERLRVEEHAAGCGRCQLHLAAMARTATVQPQEAPRRARRLWPWLMPAAGAAAAVTVWIIVQPPRDASQSGSEAPKVQVREEDSKAVPAPVEQRTTQPVESRRRDAAPQTNRAERKVRTLSKEEQPAAAPPASPAAESEPARMASTRVADVAAADVVVNRTPDGRVTWDAAREGIYGQLTAGSSPSPSVIWLVGQRGLVLRTIDGRSWRQQPFPEKVDLTSVEAVSDTSATVQTADGRVFATTDGGVTWKR